MTLQQLKYFVSVANHLSFSRAAEENYVSQTAISQQIKLLEEDLGISLFDRTHRWVRLTRAGSVYYEYAQQILDLAEMAASRARAIGSAEEQKLTVGIMRGLESIPFVEQLLDFQAAHPGLEIQLTPSHYKELWELLRDGQLDLTVVTELYSVEGYPGRRQHCIGQAAHYAVVNRQSHLARFSALTNAQLTGEVFCTVPLAKDSWNLFSHTLEEKGLKTQRLIFRDSLEAVAFEIAFHGGYTILAEPILRQLPFTKYLVTIPIENELVPINLVWNESNTNPALHSFLSSIGAEENSGRDTVSAQVL